MAGDFEEGKTGGSTLQSADGQRVNGIPLRGWKTDAYRGEERTSGLNLTGYKTASTVAKAYKRESLIPCDPGGEEGKLR